jgi:hypothetical protein
MITHMYSVITIIMKFSKGIIENVPPSVLAMCSRLERAPQAASEPCADLGGSGVSPVWISAGAAFAPSGAAAGAATIAGGDSPPEEQNRRQGR